MKAFNKRIMGKLSAVHFISIFFFLPWLTLVYYFGFSAHIFLFLMKSHAYGVVSDICMVLYILFMFFMYFAPVAAISVHVNRIKKNKKAALYSIPLLLVSFVMSCTYMMIFVLLYQAESNLNIPISRMLLDVLHRVISLFLYPVLYFIEEQSMATETFTVIELCIIIFTTLIIPTSVFLFLLPFVGKASYKFNIALKAILVLPLIGFIIIVSLYSTGMSVSHISEFMSFISLLVSMPVLGVLFIICWSEIKDQLSSIRNGSSTANLQL